MNNKYKEDDVKTLFDGSQKLKPDLTKNTINIRTLMENSSDLIMKFAKVGQCPVCCVTCEGMADKQIITQMIYAPLNEIGNEEKISLPELEERIRNEILIAEEQNTVQTYDDLAHAIMSGFIVILIDGLSYGISIGVQGFQSRSIDEPSTHINLRGSREGFVEVIRINMSMVRRRVKSPTLKFMMIQIGKRTKTDVCICYLSDKASSNVVLDIKRKLNNIDLNTILDSGYIQPFLEQDGSTVFSEIGTTERPDNFAAKLYEGRVGIIVDGTPFALIVPHLFIENFQTMDDYTQQPYYSTFLRLIRWFSFSIAVLLPGLYVALANFNPELFPNALLMNLASAKQSTPYPLMAECLIMYVMYEVMREAGLRLPKHVGHAVSIIGGLVIGEITVSAGLLGAPIILVVAITGMCSFVIPDLYDSAVILRFAFIIGGGLLGIFGLTLVGCVVLFKLCSKNSYGVPYMAPLTPFTLKAMRDVFTRISWRNMGKNDVKIQDLNGSRKK